MFKVGLKLSDETINKNNFIGSTLHCLTNINTLTDFINSKEPIKNSLHYKYKELLKEIKKLNEDKKICSPDFKEFLIDKNDFKNNKSYNPKYLINQLLTEFNLYFLSEFQDSKISDTFFITKQKINKCLNCNHYKGEIIEEKFLIFDLYSEYKKKKEQKFSIHNFLNGFTNEVNEKIISYCKICNKDTKQKEKIIFKTLPDVLIIFVDYGKDDNFEFNGEFEFNETLDFKDINNVESKLKTKEYYLSSIISVREIMKPKEFYYTFCRENENESYYCYNGEMVHEVKGISKKLYKNIIQLNNNKERLPYALIYNSIKKNNEI